MSLAIEAGQYSPSFFHVSGRRWHDAAVRKLLAASALALIWPAGSAAHGTGHEAGFLSTVSGVEPTVPGLLASVVGGDQLLSVRNWSGRTVVLLGEDGRPFLRFSGNRVERRANGAWELVKRGSSYAFHDPRIHVVGPPPERSGVVRNWRVAGTANGLPFAIRGFVGYRAPAAEPDDDGLPAWAPVAAAGFGLLALAALALAHRRRRGES
jgi:hypothetical protein